MSSDARSRLPRDGRSGAAGLRVSRRPGLRTWGGDPRAGGWLAALLGALCFLNSIGGDFAYDDHPIVRDNPRIHSLANLRDIWLRDWWYTPPGEEAADPMRDRLYRPLAVCSFALNFALHGLWPAGFHAVNVLIHAACCWLVGRLAWRLLADAGVAIVAALLFAVHPIHCEAVANIVGRAELLAALFMLLGLLTILPEAGPPRWGRLAGAGVLFFAAVMAKETAVCYLPVALLGLHAVYERPRPALRWWLICAGVLALPLVVYLPLRYVSLEMHLIRASDLGPVFNPLFVADLGGRLVAPLTILGHYARLYLAPGRLSSDYGLGVISPHARFEPETALGLAAAAALLVALWGYSRPAGVWRRLAVLSALSLASYALISNTVLLIGVSLAERLMYWPSVPILMLIAAAAVEVWQRACGPDGPLERRAGLLKACGLALLAALALRSVMRNTVWESDRTLFASDVRAFPRSVHLNGAAAANLIWEASREVDPRLRQSMLERAEDMLRTALDVHPNNHALLRSLGEARSLLGDNEGALELFQTALQLNPKDRKCEQHIAELLGLDEARERRREQLEQQIATNPGDPEARLELSGLLLATGRGHLARAHLEHVLSASPRNVPAKRLLGQVLALEHEPQRAIELLRQVLEREPDDWETHANLASLLAERDPAASLHHARRAAELQPGDLRTQINLAEALLAAGRREEALRQFQRVLDGLRGDHPLKPAIAARLREVERRGR
jgi:tetratricopeptide (TPR) repeat protein